MNQPSGPGHPIRLGGLAEADCVQCVDTGLVVEVHEDRERAAIQVHQAFVVYQTSSGQVSEDPDDFVSPAGPGVTGVRVRQP